MNKKQFGMGALMVVGLALTVVASKFTGTFASIFWLYQPETPSSLK